MHLLHVSAFIPMDHSQMVNLKASIENRSDYYWKELFFFLQAHKFLLIMIYINRIFSKFWKKLMFHNRKYHTLKLNSYDGIDEVFTL